LAERFNVRVAWQLVPGSLPAVTVRQTPLASPVRRWCSSPCFPHMAAGPSNASREVLSPTAHSGCAALSRGCQPFRDGPASTFVAPAHVPARVVLAVFDAVATPAIGPYLAVRGCRGPRRVMHRRFLTSDVPLPVSRRTLSQPGCHRGSSAPGVVLFAVLIPIAGGRHVSVGRTHLPFPESGPPR